MLNIQHTMRTLLLLLACALPLGAQTMTGRWEVTADFFGTPLYYPLHLSQRGDTLTGDFSGDTLAGTVHGNAVHFLAKDTEGGTEEFTGTLQGSTLSGSSIWIASDERDHPATHAFTAVLVPPVAHHPGAARRYDFTPTVFYREFSPRNPPALRLTPGDTLHSWSVDAGGRDAHGVRRVLGGNPQTGPFYVEGAMPGDILVVHLTRIRLNRDWAMSDDAVVGRGLDPDLSVKMKDGGKDVRWHLDLAKGTAAPDDSALAPHLARGYSVPLRPMLGCIATAAPASRAAPNTGDSGPYGGNMDFNEITEGATVYLPVYVPGALLYFGDGHAAQGDGELTGNALETSMDIELTVDIIPAKSLPSPRVESATHIMVIGLAGSIDDAFRSATANMADWLEADYQLTPSEIAQVLGSAAEYKVSEVADRNAGVVLKIDKARLRALH
jgi:amidase